MTHARPSIKLGSVKGIGLREASEKYGIPLGTLSRWSSPKSQGGAGLIRRLKERDLRGQPILLFEDDVAQVAAKYKPGRGRWNRPDLQDVATAS